MFTDTNDLDDVKVFIKPMYIEKDRQAKRKDYIATFLSKYDVTLHPLRQLGVKKW